ncbi:MAG: tetratricopeptide repeat protein [Flavobacteriales bacterium]|nr:tetratricopeptide repeat protein [Flavobacteriales bacterium]
MSVEDRMTAMEAFARMKYGGTDPDSLIICAQRMRELAAEKGTAVHIGRSQLLRAMGFLRKGESDATIAYVDSAIAILSEAGEDKHLMSALNLMGNANANKGDFARAIAALTRALPIAETLKDSSMEARLLGNIGALYHMQDDLENALEYYQRRLVIAEAIGQKDILSEVVGNIAIIHETRGELATALSGYERAMGLARDIGYSGMIASAMHNMANVHLKLGQPKQALELNLEELALAQEIGDVAMETAALAALADAHLALGDLTKANDAGARSLRMADASGDMNLRRDAALMLFKVEKARGNDHAALAMHELYIALRDSIKSDENAAAMMSQKFQYEFDKKEALLTAEQEKKDALAAEEMRRKDMQRNAFIGGFVLMLALAGTFLFQRNRINKEKRRSEELLLNILPEEVALELKAKGEAEAVHLDQVTVLFTDFKGFTAMSEVLSPRDLVKDLHECFSAFDRITEKHGIEKIKTIGDAYMAAGGLPTPNTTHAIDVIQAAFEMRDFIAEGKARKIAAGLPYFEIRIGIHTGPVVAGIVGVKKFAYDIWGDTVNTASRMESSGEVGQVNISEATYALVKNEIGLTFTPRGKVQAKGKGEMAMYFAGRCSEGALVDFIRR